MLDTLIGIIPAILLLLFKWHLEDVWFKKKWSSYEDEEEQQEEDYGYIE
jgi:hypothetical protein